MSYIQTSNNTWEVVIGLEVHAQVISKSKLFSSSSTQFGASPNVNVNVIDLALPGALPILNSFCVDQAIKTGLGINAKINKFSRFDRKNYYYPDLPQGYQISQFYYPIVSDGKVTVELGDGKEKIIRIERIHLEQDAGKSIHDAHPSKTYIDLNRCGVALMEIVTHPDIRSAQEASLFLKKLRTILRYLKTCDGNMEEGSLRADVNVSVHCPDTQFGTRAEIKNVNSMKFIVQAVNFEVARQIGILEAGGEILQETRFFDSTTGVTRSMRDKEDAGDYRYFPDPDLFPLIISQDRIDKIANSIPELPDVKSKRLQDEYKLSAYDANFICSELELSEYYEEGLKFFDNVNQELAKLFANWLLVDLFSYINKDNCTIKTSKVNAANLAELVHLVHSNVISGKIAKDVLEMMWNTGESSKKIVAKHGLEQITDLGEIEKIVVEVLEENVQHVIDYRSGKDKLFGFFVGQVMKKSGGKLNPAAVNEMILKKLS